MLECHVTLMAVIQDTCNSKLTVLASLYDALHYKNTSFTCVFSFFFSVYTTTLEWKNICNAARYSHYEA